MARATRNSINGVSEKKSDIENEVPIDGSPLVTKAAKAALKQKEGGSTADGSSTAVDSAPVSSSGTTPMGSKNPSSEELTMAKLALATDRCAFLELRVADLAH